MDKQTDKNLNSEIKKLKKQNLELEEKLKRFQEAAINAREWVWEVNLEGFFTYSSESVELLLGYSSKEITGNKSIFDLLAESDKSRIKAEILKGFSDKKTFRHFILKMNDLKMNDVWISFNASPIYDNKNKLIGYKGTNQDITEQISGNSSLEVKDAALNFSLNGVTILDMDGNILFVNNSFLDMWKFHSSYEIIGTHISDFWENSKLIKEKISELKNELKYKDELIAKCSDKSTFIVNLGFSILKDPLGKPIGILGTFIDVTHDRKIREALDISLGLNTEFDNSSIEEVMQFGLEECERITGSKIGYFHFVNDDQKTIELVTWTQNTLKWCNVKEKVKNYPISQAGIWVDCLRQGKPIINNDYDSYPDKKGLPDGHAKITREIDVPVFEKDIVRAIIGVGNKEHNYTKLDIELVQIIADNVWNIVRRKKTESELHKSREKTKSQFKAIPIPTYIWKYDKDEFYLDDYNAAVEDMIGGRITQLTKIPLSQMFFNRDDIVEDFRNCYNKKETIKKELEYSFGNKDKRILDVKYVYVEPDSVMMHTHDITEERTSEQKLKVSEERLSLIFNSSTDLLILFDVNKIDLMTIEMVNDQFVEYTKKHGITLEKNDYPGMSISKYLIDVQKSEKNRVEQSLDYIRDVISKKETVIYKSDINMPDGRMLSLDINLIPIIENNECIRILYIGKDVTEQSQAERALIESEKKLSLIFNSSPNFLALLKAEAEGKYSFETVNQEFVKDNIKSGIFLGSEEYEGLDLFNYLTEIQGSSPKRASFVINRLDEVYKYQKISSYENGVRMIDGRDLVIDVNLIPIVENGICTRILYMGKDITDKKLGEEKLKESEKNFRALYNETPAMLHSIDEEGYIISVSDYWLRKMGYSREEVIGKKSIEFMTDESRNKVKNREEEFTKLGYCTDIPYKMNKKSGEQIDVLLSAIAINSENDNPVKAMAVIIDVTEKRKAENALRLSEERYRMLSELSFEGILLHRDGVAHDVNDAFVKLTGYPHNELIDENLVEKLIAPQYRDEIKARIKNKVNYPVEAEIIKSDGTFVPVEIDSRDVVTVDGAFRVSAIRDITEKVAAKKAVKESEERYKLLSDLTLEGIVIHKNLIIQDVNQSLCRITGYKRDEIIGKNIIDVFIEDDYLEEVNKNYLLSNPDPYEIEVRHKLNYKVRVELEPRSIKRDGEHFRVTAVRDISEKYLTQEHIRKLSSAVEQSQVSIAILDIDGKIEYVNPKFLSVSGYERDELLGRSPRILDTGKIDDTDHDKIWQQVRMGNEWSGVFENKRKNGEIYWESAIISPIKNSYGEITHYVEVKEDITEKVKTEQELESYRQSLESIVKQRTSELEDVNKKLAREIVKQKEAEEKVKLALGKEIELNELKTRFISTASHEFRTPLTSILTSAEILEMFGLECTPEEFNDQIRRIINSVEYLTNLMDDVLTMSRTDSGKIQFEPRELDVKQICFNLMEEININSSQEHNLVFTFDAETEYFKLDEKLIRFILSNLLSNAVKYSPGGGDIVFSIKSEKNKLVFTIKDSGLGIPEEDQKLLFEPFHRAVNTRELPGTGLGLSIVKKSVELHHGTIEFESKEQVGTTFIVKVPIY